MRWSVGMPAYRNFEEVYFTVQSLRLHHDLNDCEIIIIDNFGDPRLEEFCREKGNGLIRYEKYTEVQGTAAPRNRLFEVAIGDNVLCMDSHVLLRQGFFDKVPFDDGLYHGACLFNHFKGYSCAWVPIWARNMWGVWDDTVQTLPDASFEIWGSGLGVFFCRREAWLGFNPDFRKFGGEEGYIHEKYRQAGRKVWCDPSKIWVHFFNNIGRKIPYEHSLVERVRNYLIGFKELGLDTTEMEAHFGQELIDRARGMIVLERSGLHEINNMNSRIDKTNEVIPNRPLFTGTVAHGNIWGN